MNKQIQSALDWPARRSEIRALLSKIKYNHDMYRLLQNIDKMTTELSKLEVEARQRRNTSAVEAKVTEINEAILYIEKMLTFLILVD